MGNRMLIESISEPLDGARAAKIDVDTGAGHLTIDRLTGDEQLLASGTLQYFEKQGPPSRNLSSSDGQAVLTVKGSDPGTGRPWFLPWIACAGGAYEWRIHLNPTLSSDITAHSGGGNVKLDLAGMAITRVFADTGGGNVDVALPDNASSLTVTARTGGGNVTLEIGSGTRGTSVVDATSGAGNVVVRIPGSVAARVHAKSGLGRVTVDPRFGKVDKNTYQSSDYDDAVNRIEITASSGAGNVSVNTK